MTDIPISPWSDPVSVPQPAQNPDWHPAEKTPFSRQNQEYAKDLDANLRNLVWRLKHKSYHARPVRRKYIPKGDGKLRPLGIPTLEDKLVQYAVARILSAIYEADFLPCRYGYREGRNAQDAIRDLTDVLFRGQFEFVVEADIKGFFDHLQPEWLLKMLAVRIDDGALLQLVRKWLRAGILEEDGRMEHPETGTPQGGIVTPRTQWITSSFRSDFG